MKPQKTFGMVVLVFLIDVLSAQPGPPPSKPSNLNFEEVEAGGSRVPGWSSPPAWTIVERRRGEECREGACAMITRPESPPPNSFGNLMQGVSAQAYAGKRVVYRVAVRVEGTSPEDSAMPWLRVDLPDQKTGFFDNMADRPVMAGKGWAVYEIAGEVDPAARQIYFGVMARGQARVWVDDASLVAVARMPEGLEKEAIRAELGKRYQRIDAAQSTGGRPDDILGMALPEARSGSSGMRVPLTNYVKEVERNLARPGTKLAVKTEIIGLTVFGDNAQAITRGESRSQTADQSRTMRKLSQDVWVRGDGDEWKLKDVTVTSMYEVHPTLPLDSVSRVAGEISAKSIPLSTAVAGGPREDLAAFGKAVGAARIVALGESTHGTREIFQMKHRLLEYLVREKGFTVFAIEGNWPESQAADRYIKTGEGNPREALKDMYFWTWQTEEVLAMLEWMRAFNQAPGNHPILSFSSFDMQTWKGAADRVVAFIKQHGSKDDAAAVAAAYQGQTDLSDRSPTSAAFVPVFEQSEKVTALFIMRRGELAKSAGEAAVRDALQMTRIVSQALRLRTPGVSPDYREEMMANHVEWLAKEAHPGEKIVLWAHNAHVSIGVDQASGWRPLGGWLREKFGRQMYVLGFAMHLGSVRAIGSGLGHGSLGSYEIPAAPSGSGSAVLSAAGKPIFFLDFAPLLLGNAAGSPLAEFLKALYGFRESGATWRLADAAENNFRAYALAESYDGVIFLEKTSAARGL